MKGQDRVASPSETPVERPAITVCFSATGGGGQKAATMVIAGLVANGWPVRVLCSRNTGPFMHFVPPTVTVEEVGSKSPIGTLRALERHLLRHKPAAVLAHQTLFNSLLPIARFRTRSKVRLALVQHNSVRGLTHASGHRALRLLPYAARFLWPRADRMVTVSDSLRRELLGMGSFSESRTSVIYNPVVDESTWSAQLESVDHAWFVAPSIPTIVTAGNLNPQKDHATLLQAFAMLRRERPCRLVLLGDGELRGNLTALAETLGVADDVWMPGFVPNPLAFMSRSSVFAMSSRFEGLPYVLIEALACGATIVATDCPTGPAEILEEGRFGTLVPVGDAKQLAAALGEALRRSSDPERQRERARARAFSVDASIHAYDRLLRELIGSSDQR